MATSGPSERKSANVQGTGAKGNTDAWQRGQAGAAGSQPVPAPLGVHLEWEGEQETGPGLPAAWPDLEKPDLVTRGFFADAIQHVPIDTKVRVVIDSSIEPALAKPTVKKDNDKRLRGLHAARAQAIADSHREYQQRRREHPLAEDGNTCNCNHVGGGKSTKADLESARRRAISARAPATSIALGMGRAARCSGVRSARALVRAWFVISCRAAKSRGGGS